MRHFYRLDHYGDYGLHSSWYYYQTTPPRDVMRLDGKPLKLCVELTREEWLAGYYAKHVGGEFDAQKLFNALSSPFVPKSYEHLADHLLEDTTCYE